MKGARRKLDDKSLKCQFLIYEGAHHMEGGRRKLWLVAEPAGPIRGSQSVPLVKREEGTNTQPRSMGRGSHRSRGVWRPFGTKLRWPNRRCTFPDKNHWKCGDRGNRRRSSRTCSMNSHTWRTGPHTPFLPIQLGSILGEGIIRKYGDWRITYRRRATGIWIKGERELIAVQSKWVFHRWVWLHCKFKIENWKFLHLCRSKSTRKQKFLSAEEKNHQLRQ